MPRCTPNRPGDARFPSVVLEAGWTEPSERLLADARHWQVGSRKEVRVVLLLKVYPAAEGDALRAVFSVPKRPVRPSLGPDGYLSVRPQDSPGRTGGDCGCLRWRNFPGNSG